ncbi:hypothetical protein M441DRAFT_397737 [Trichoderma asperellum CBS 433.97]|uniref:Uncharacterized protein n=1 Tax=Trichoderma asperellum (strain ATCC 204424 / CBS 433.97 / NBRC 101777) TaxID=1042311 RepID=A0A2T3Z9D0_TRIA4|nr:hypothetical protein M441DRAFT_397737 [Trichoderma asperellum CBS 433.97]PTB41390.1 hypothetical protein M441DRAFT_397737 [Trichoderma asperellum CBS 433.97]
MHFRVDGRPTATVCTCRHTETEPRETFELSSAAVHPPGRGPSSRDVRRGALQGSWPCLRCAAFRRSRRRSSRNQRLVPTSFAVWLPCRFLCSPSFCEGALPPCLCMEELHLAAPWAYAVEEGLVCMDGGMHGSRSGRMERVQIVQALNPTET